MFKKKTKTETKSRPQAKSLKTEKPEKVEESQQTEETEKVASQPVPNQPAPIKPAPAPVVVNPRSVLNSVVVEINGRKYRKNYRADGTTDLD